MGAGVQKWTVIIIMFHLMTVVSCFSSSDSSFAPTPSVAGMSVTGGRSIGGDHEKLAKIGGLVSQEMIAGLLEGGGGGAGVEVGGEIKPALFVFGDSLVDPGNNNYIDESYARASTLPNGVDFPDGPTGRFCNGRMAVDVLAQLIGIPFPTPYLSPKTNALNIFSGINYASAASGILNYTGTMFERYARDTVAQLTLSGLRPDQIAKFLSNSIVSIVIGSNDFVNNYWMLASTQIREQYNPREFNILLLNNISRQLMALYNLGFRKFLVTGIAPIGCIPAMRMEWGTNENCVEMVNAQVRDYNDWGLQDSLLPQLRQSLLGSTFLYANVYDIFNDILIHPQSYGFKNAMDGCCGPFMCTPIFPYCKYRRDFVFWDLFHPTEAANIVIADRLYNGGPDVMSPMNVRQLVDLIKQENK